MWIFLNDAALSVVEKRGDPSVLLVRSRIAGDIERAIPDAAVFQDPTADYRYRAWVRRDDLKAALAAAVDRIDYGNFKNSVRDHRRHDAYMGVWSAMARVFGAYGRPWGQTLQRVDPADLGLPKDPDIDAYLNG